MPIYRLLEIFKREGVTLSPATVSGWLESAARLMEPLYENLQKQVLASPYLQVDETRLQVLDGKEMNHSQAREIVFQAEPFIYAGRLLNRRHFQSDDQGVIPISALRLS